MIAVICHGNLHHSLSISTGIHFVSDIDMNMKKYAVFLAVCLLPVLCVAQAVNNTLAYKNICNDSYFRLSYENDFFGMTDEYYTQGMAVEIVVPGLKNFILNDAMFHLNNSYTRYGVGLEHNGYTPSSISIDTILRNDRPFAAVLVFKTFNISIDTLHKRRLSTIISTGIIGPAAGGKEMQTGIHRELHNILPHGWDNQIKNDIALNYEINIEQQLYAYRNIFSVSVDGIARVGTLSDKMAGGLTLMGGYFQSPFDKHTSHCRDLRIYGYEHARINIVGYDATMQGGVFDVSSPYTIDASDISRVVLENRFGFVISWQRLYLEYFQSLYGREFVQGRIHNFGGVQLAFGI